MGVFLTKDELTITVDAVLSGKELVYNEGPINITIDSRGVICSISRGVRGLDLRGFTVIPPLVNMHIHVLDYAITDEGYDLDIDSIVGEPYGLKYVLLRRVSKEFLKEIIKEFYRLMERFGIGFSVEFRELGIDYLLLDYDRRPYGRIVLGMPSSHEPSVNELRLIANYSHGYAISSPLYFSRDVLKQIFSIARENNLVVFSHIAEVKELAEEGDLNYLLSIGRPTAIVHGVWLSRDDLELYPGWWTRVRP